ncbi:hypothetical protein ACFL5A_01160 [Gemmatimonadota bacterium]
MAMKVRATTVFLALCLFGSALPPSVVGQTPEFYVEGEVVSRYAWRGLSLSSSLNFQPFASMTVGAVDLGVWSSWGREGYQEVDLSLGYSLELPKGGLYLVLNDYFVAGDDVSFGDFMDYGGVEDGEPTGLHTLELMVEYYGPEEFPIRALLARNVHGDPDGSWYGEVGTDLSAGGFEIAPVVGMTLGASPYYYGPDGTTITQLGLTVSRELFSFADRSLYCSGAVIHNPDLRETYWVLAFGL